MERREGGRGVRAVLQEKQAVRATFRATTPAPVIVKQTENKKKETLACLLTCVVVYGCAALPRSPFPFFSAFWAVQIPLETRKGGGQVRTARTVMLLHTSTRP